MSVIETLYSVFKVETQDLDKGLAKADKGLNDLVAQLTSVESRIKELTSVRRGLMGEVMQMSNAETAELLALREKQNAIEGAIAKTNQMDKSSSKLAGTLGNLAKSVGVAAVGFFAVRNMFQGFSQATEATIQLKTLSEQTRMSMKDVQTWGHATVEFGGSAEAFQTSIASLNNSMQEMAMTGNSSVGPVMRYLGVRMTEGARQVRPMNDLLLDLADKFQGLDKQRAFDVGKRLGLDAGTVQMLMQGREATEKLLKRKSEMAAFDEKNYETSIRFKVLMDESSMTMKKLYMEMGTIALPFLEMFAKGIGWAVNMLTGFSDWVKENKVFVVTFFLTAAAVIATVMMPTLIGLAGAAWGALIPVLGLAIGFLILNAPLIGIAAIVGVLIGLFALLVDELWTWYEGGQTVFGGLLQAWEDFVGWFAAAWDKTLGWLLGSWDMLKQKARELWATIFPIDEIKEKIAEIQDIAGSALSFIFGANATPINAVAGGGGGSVATTNNYNVRANATVNTQATDAQGVSRAVGNTLSGQLRDAVGQFDDGIEG